MEPSPTTKHNDRVIASVYLASTMDLYAESLQMAAQTLRRDSTCDFSELARMAERLGQRVVEFEGVA